MVRRIAVLLTAVLIFSGCSEQRLFAVKAVAAGIPSLAPFFEEDGSLGKDRGEVKSERPQSGLQQGNTPGLYGGTRKQQVCDVERLKDFLTDPRNRKKAREWARVVGISPDRIGEYLDGLTPVLLRHDTLVKNHDYKKGRAVPYDSLLEAGVAVLVDDQGLPAVKCSCGNPLKSFDKDPQKISVEFEDGNDRWDGYDKSGVVTVRPSPRPLKQIALLDVDDPGTGISRPVGSTGDADVTFDTTEEQAVPTVVGRTFAEASMELSARGLAVAYPEELPPADAVVTSSDPEAGTPLEFGATVALGTTGDGDGTGDENGDGSGEPSTPGTPDDPASPPEETPGEESSSGTATDGPGTPASPDTPSTGSSTPGSSTPGTPSSSAPDDPTSGGGTPKPPPEEQPTEPTTAGPPPSTVSGTPPTADPTSAGPGPGPTATGSASGGPVSSDPAQPTGPGTGTDPGTGTAVRAPA
ncbi:DUF6777 domain-containing protein [Streptomyces sp. MMBL 11-3]|uniref:DUF6777 domain-containing protein n=1 Tax=Streptomyces sp. MMBL 11-3 TaxID=3382639 RepID=UPI0039B40E9F